MPNTLAYVVLFSWPVVVYVLFRRLPPAAALGWSILAGYLLLPTRAGLDLPAVPTIDQDGMPALSAALMLLLGVGAAAAARRPEAAGQAGDVRADPSRPGRLLVTSLLILLLLSPIMTLLTNAEPVIAGPRFIPGLRPYDAGAVLGVLGIMILPFLLARRYFASPESHVTLLKTLVLALLGYSLLILYEIRMSPQLNIMIYGFFPHDFLQHMRAGGFRPVVFVHHGLWLAILVAMAVLAAAALWRQRLSEGARAGQWLFAAIYLLLVLFLSNSLGAFAIALMLVPAALFLGVRGQLLLAGILAGMVLLYPMLRGAHLVPVDRVVAIAESISAERAASFVFRLDNEEALLARASEKPLFGWGTWGRNELYDPETGRSISVADGAWIIVIGVFGWLGYIAQFGLLTLPILFLALRRGTLGLSPATAGLALVMSANLLDLIPNATLTPVTWLIGGALAGRYAYPAPVPDEEGTVPGPAPAAPRRDWGLVTDTPAGPPTGRRPRTARAARPAAPQVLRRF